MQTYTLPGTAVHAAYKRLLRTGKIWKLHPLERALLKLTTKLKQVRSKALLEALEKILGKASPRTLLKLKALKAGLEILRRKTEQAARLGYTGARKWLLDLETALYLGISHMNTPPIYR